MDKTGILGKKNTYSWLVTNILIAICISLIVNFSIFLLQFMPQPPGGGNGRGWMRGMSSGSFQTVQFTFYAILSFIMLTVSTIKMRDGKPLSYILRILICTLIAFVAYFISPQVTRRGEIMLTLHSHRIFDPTLLVKISFTLIVPLLYGKIIDLIDQRRNILLDYEILKNENLENTYTTLVNQINPHFFFNSLNSLSMLVREKHNDKAITYIDQLSDTFRYIIRNGQTGMTTLEEELRFVESYRYLLEIRYEGKLFFDISIDEKFYGWNIPSLTLQPLIENVVKHNVITKSSPMRISITTKGNNLTVSNHIFKKIHEEESTGTGLENLSRRYTLLTGKDITVTNDGNTFSVVLPLTIPSEQ